MENQPSRFAYLAQYFERDLRLGLLLIAIGVGFTIFGILFLLDKGFIALGSFSLTLGLGYMVGFPNYYRFLVRTRQTKIASIGYFFGIFLVISGHIYTGLVIETASFLCLFGPVRGIVLGVLRMVPVVGRLVTVLGG